MSGIETSSQGGFIDPQLVRSSLDVPASPHERVSDGVRIREQVARCRGGHLRLCGFILAATVATAQVLELVGECASPLSLPEAPVEPDPRLTITDSPNTRAELDVVNDDVRESAEVAPRVGQVHARDVRSWR